MFHDIASSQEFTPYENKANMTLLRGLDCYRENFPYVKGLVNNFMKTTMFTVSECRLQQLIYCSVTDT